jgi:DNA mismatch endonuclease, patch repair protein
MTRSAKPSTSLDVNARMSRQRRRDTTPEVELRKKLHHLGLRFRVNFPVPGLSRRTIDIAFTRKKIAVFVDGCFWHVCPQHGTWPATNEEWWRTKLLGNAKRDRETDDLLVGLGWHVLRVWEHENVEVAVQRVLDALQAEPHLQR